MSRETSKSRARRVVEGYYATLFQGYGIDIGCGDDPVTPTCLEWDVAQGDAQDLAGIAQNSFDWVYSSHCLEDLDDPQQALRRWWEVLKPGGKMLVVVPDEDLYEQGQWPSRYNGAHKHTFTVHKSASWSPASLNLLELVADLPHHKVVWIRTCDFNYDYSGGIWDRTQGNAEAQIELLVEKVHPDFFIHECNSPARMLRAQRERSGGEKDGIVYLDTVPPLEQQVQHGSVGRHGELGYEGKQVQIQRKTVDHALSAHAPSKLVFDLEGEFRTFSCRVALNDDVRRQAAQADFSIIGDGRTIAATRQVRSDQAPLEIRADVTGVHRLELQVSTSNWHHCHSVWLDPYVDANETASVPPLLDCLGRTQIFMPDTPIQARRCIATVVSPGYTHLLEDLLGSLEANGGCSDAVTVVFAIDPDETCRQVIDKYGVQMVECRSLYPLSPAAKVILYSVARIVEAQYYLCLDADTLVLADLNPLFDTLAVCDEGSILVASDSYISHYDATLLECFYGFYEGEEGDLALLSITPEREGSYPLVVNDGVFAGGRASLLELDGIIRGLLPQSNAWLKFKPHNGSRCQFLFNIALARMGCGVSLHETWNLLTDVREVESRKQDGRIEAHWNGHPVRILHYAGAGRNRQTEWRERYRRTKSGGA